MLLNKAKTLNIVFILFVSSWIWNGMQAFYMSYVSLLFLFIFQMGYVISNYPSLRIRYSSYQGIFNINYFSFLILCFTLFLLLSMCLGTSSVILPVKILFYLLIPLHFLVFSDFYKFFNFNSLKYIIVISFLFQLLFSFVIGKYDPNIGKIHEEREWFLFSSNNLSIYMVYSITVLSWVYYSFCKSNKLFIFFVTLLPLLHFSKSHIIFYILSLVLAYALYKKKFFYILLSLFFLVLNSYIVYINNDYLMDLINNKSIKKVLLGNQLLVDNILGNVDVSIWEFITKVGDGSRTHYFQVYTEALKDTFWIGMGDRADVILLKGADYHNMLFFFHIQYGFFGFLFYFMILLYFLYLGIFKWKKIGFILIFCVLYFILRGIFTVLDPYRFLLFAILLTFIEKKLQYDENINNIRGKTPIY